MFKWLLRIVIALAALLAAVVVAAWLLGPWAVERFLRKEIAAGDGRIRISGPQFRWNLDLTADSLRYDSPSLTAEADGVRISANLFRSLFRFSPSVDLALDSVALRLHAVDDSLEEKVEKPEKGPPAFPDIRIPASVDVQVGRLSAAGDTASLGSLERVALSTRGERALSLTIGRASMPALGARRPSLSLDLDWSDTADVAGRVRLDMAGGGPDSGGPGKGAGDGLDLEARLEKADLRRGRLALKSRVASVAAYADLLGRSPYVLAAGGWEGELEASLDVRAGLRAALALDGRFGGFSGRHADSLPFALGPQALALRLDFRDTAGTWSVRSDGRGRGESLLLEGRLAAAARDSLQNPAWLARNLAVTLSGKIAGVPVRAAGKTLPAELTVGRAAFTPDAPGRPGRAELSARTGDGTTVDARLGRGRKGWDGTFSAQVGPREAWLLAFVDTNVAFRRFTVAGEMEGGRVRAVTEALYLAAYGVLADTLVLVHRYDGRAYVLERGRLSRAGTAWDLSGRVDLAKRHRPMAFRMASREAGSVAVSLPRPTVIEAEVRGLAVERIPYKGLDTLGGYAPRVTADFRWDRLAKTGSAEVSAAARYKGESAKVDARAAWDAKRLAVERLDAALGTMRARASGAVRLRGRQFFELKGLGLEDLETVSLEADRFDLARAARTALPDPPLLSGTLHGRFAYSPERGFEGAYDIRDVQPAATRDQVALKEVRIRGDGDTLRILAVTVSEKEPLLNDSLSLILGGVLEDVQTLGVEVRAGKDLRLGFRGRMNAFRDIAGALAVSGSVQLPGKSGQLRALRLRADIATPFKDALANLKVTADTLLGEYVVPGLDTQSFSAPGRLAAGRLVIPDLSIKGRAGTRVRGRVEYNLTGARTAVARLEGGSLVVQVGTQDKVQLRDLKVDLRADSASVDLKARVGSGSFEHVKPPMRMAGDFSRVEVSYRSPLGKVTTTRDKAIPARLRVSAVMDSSHLRYRLRGMEALRNVFRDAGNKDGGGRRQGQARVSRPLHLEVSVETAGSGNQVETDILRFPYVGNFSLRGIMPYALAQGRINGTGGELGTKKQAYLLDRLELKWLNAPLEEGTISAEASKSLKSACRADELRDLLSRGQDTTCKAITRVQGAFTDIKFAYDTDCGGAFGSGADVTALLYSVRRGCWSGSFAGGGSGMTYQEQALALVEPFASQGLTWAAERLSGKWIESAEVSGLGAFASREDASGPSGTAAGSEQEAAREAVALEVMSREFWRLRLRLRSSYAPEDADELDPWAYRMGLEWRPPVARMVEDPKWKRRLQDKVVVEAAVYTEQPVKTAEAGQDEVQQRLGLNYNYDFWGYWWRKRRTPPPGSVAPPRPPVLKPAEGGAPAPGTAAAPDSTR